MKKTLQDQYLLIKEGKGHKGVFLTEAKREFPHIVRTAATFEEAVAAMVRKGKTFMPDAQNHRIYAELFNDVYKKSFNTLDPIYRKIAKITGYPAEG